MSTGLKNKQLSVTVTNTDELTHTVVTLVGKGLVNIGKTRAGASEEGLKLSLRIDDTPVRAYLDEITITTTGKATVTANAVDIEGDETTEYSVTLTLGAEGWTGTAKVAHLSIVN
jgi:hypothetical protein